MTIIIIVLWFISIPVWPWMFRSLLNVDDPDENVNLAMILFPFYIAFMFGDLLTSIMYGLGRTNYIAFKSFLGNVVIGSCFTLTLVDMIPLTLYSVSLMFGGGLLLGFVTSCALVARIIRKNDFLV